jgi:predicted aldo/keto reductase-like oxidoreductase
MRFDFYFKGQGREKAAVAQYAELKGKKADACENCAGFCEGYCPHHVPVQLLLQHAHHTLTLS